MWSRKPTPVAACPSPAPSSASVSSTFVSLVRRTISDRSFAHAAGILLDAGLHRLGVRGEPLGTRDRRPGPRQLRREGATRTSVAIAGGRCRTDSAEAKRAAPPGRQGVVGAGHVVAERRSRTPPTNRQPARRTRGASASASAPTSCRCSGASASTKASAASSVGPRSLVLDGGRHGASSIAGRRERHHERVLAVLGLRAHVERHRLGIGALGEDHGQVARAGEASMPTTPETCRLASCTHTFPGPAITSARGTPRCLGERGDGLCAAHPVDLLHTAQRAGRQHRGIDVAARAAGEQTTTSSTPAAWAVTAPITTVDWGRARARRARRSRPARPGSRGP